MTKTLTPDKKIADELNQTLKFFENERKPVEVIWQWITDLTMPRDALMSFALNNNRGASSRTSKMFDGTAASAAVLAADGIQGWLVSEQINWFKLAFVLGNRRPIDIPEVRQWLQDLEEVYYYLYHKSNFYEALSEILLDSMGPATSTIYVEPNRARDSLRFHALHPKEIYIDQNKDGEIDTHYRVFPMSNKDILKNFDHDKLGKDFLKQAKESPYTQKLMMHCVFPREDRDFTKKDKLNKPFASYYKIKDSDDLLSTGGYVSNPYITYRPRVVSDEKYGRGFSWDALSNIKRVNQMEKGLLRLAHLVSDPPVNYPSETHGDIEIDPHGMNPYTDPRRVVFPMTIGGNYPVAAEHEQSVRRAIERAYRTDLFMLMQTLRDKTYTATQFSGIQGEQAVLLSTMLSRISSELLDPVFDRTFDIGMELGWIPDIPDVLLEYAGNEIRPEYIGPLAQLARKHHANQGMNYSLEQIEKWARLYPQITMVADPIELGRHICINGGLPENILLDKEEIAAKIEAQSQQEQELIEAEKTAQLAEAYQKTNKSPEPGSPAGKMFGGEFE